jgi:hypothetical protein
MIIKSEKAVPMKNLVINTSEIVSRKLLLRVLKDNKFNIFGSEPEAGCNPDSECIFKK